MEKAKRLALALTFAALFGALPSLGMGIDEYYKAYEEYLRTGSAAAKSQMDDFRWPPKINALDSLLNGSKFLALLKDPVSQSVSNAKLAYGLEALGKLFKASELGAPSDNPTLTGVQAQYREMRLDAVRVLKQAYLNPPGSRDINHFDGTIAVALKSLGETLPEKRENPAGNVPVKAAPLWLRVKELSARLAKPLAPGEDQTKLGKELAKLLEEAQALKIPREERFKVAKDLLESWSLPSRWPLVAETGALVGKLIGKEGGVEKFGTGDESEVKEAYTNFFTTHLDNPEKIPFAQRFLVLDLADGQLEQLSAARHPLVRFVYLAERSAGMSPQGRAPWMERAKALLPLLDSVPLRPMDRFPLAQKLMDAIESDSRLDPKSSGPNPAKTFLYPDLEILATGLGSLLSTTEVKRAESLDTQGVNQTRVRANAENLLTRMASMQRANTQYQNAVVKALSDVGGVPVFDADSYLKALEELVDLEKAADPTSYTRRRKLEKALIVSQERKYFDSLVASERNRHLDRLSALVSSESKVALPLAFHAIEALGKIESKRRVSMPEALVARLQELSGMDSRTSESLEQLKKQAAATLTVIGYQPAVEITTASQYLSAIRKVGEHEGPATEETRALEEAVERFDLKKLDQNMKPAERAKALSLVLPVLNGNSRWAKAKALEAAVPLMGKTTLRDSETAPVRDRIWELTSLGPDASVVDREIRLKAISALEGLGEKPVNSLREWVEALELAHSSTQGFQRVGADRLRPVDLYSLEQGLLKSTPAEIRTLLSRLSAILQDPKTALAVRTRALAAFGEASAPEVRRGAGVPRSGLNAVRAIANDADQSLAARNAAEQALLRLGVSGNGALSEIVELDLTDTREKTSLDSVLEKLLAKDPQTLLPAIGALESWSLQEFYQDAGLVKARRSADTFAQLLKSDDERVRRAALRQVWRWARDSNSLPPWLSENGALREALISGMASGAPEERAMAVEIVGNRLPKSKTSPTGLVGAVQKVLQSGDSSEEARFAAAQALLKHQPAEASSPEAVQRQLGLRAAFAKAPERTKPLYASLLFDLEQNGAARPADPALLAARWLKESVDSAGDLNTEKLSGLVRLGLASNDPAVAKKSWAALNWLTSEPETGRERSLPHEPNLISLPTWFKREPSLLAAILGQVANSDPAIREEAIAFLRSRRPAEQMEPDESLRLAAWRALWQSNRYGSSSAALASFIKPTSNKVLWTSSEAHAAMRAAIALNPQFHPEAVSEIVRAVSQVDSIRFEDGPGQVSREAIAKDILNLVQALETYGSSATIPAAFALAKLTWKGSGKTEIPKELTDSLVKTFRTFASQTDENELELPRFAREALQAMGRKEKLLAPGDPSRRQRAERPSLVSIVGRLLSEFPAVQEEAVADLSKWRVARSGEKTFQEELEEWRKQGGPDFDTIVARVLSEPEAGKEAFGSPTLRSALAAELVELVKTRASSPYFHPGQAGAESTSRVMAQLLFSDNPGLRGSAEAWAKRYRPPEEGGDPFLPKLIAEALADPKRQARALQVLNSLILSRLDSFQAPSWVTSSIPIQKSLLKLVAALPKNEKQEASELLLSKLASVFRVKTDEVVRNMVKTDGGYRLELTPEQEQRRELVTEALKILETGDAFGKVAAMEYLAAIKVPDSRITEKLFEFAKNPAEPSELRAHALEALSKRTILWDYSARSPEVDALVSWVWEKFLNEKDPNIRHEAARFIFSHTGTIRQMPSPPQSFPINGKVETTGHAIRIGLRELEKMTASNPLPESWKAAARTAYDEVFFGSSREKPSSISSFTKERPLGRSQSREELCAWATSLLGSR